MSLKDLLNKKVESVTNTDSIKQNIQTESNITPKTSTPNSFLMGLSKAGATLDKMGGPLVLQRAVGSAIGTGINSIKNVLSGDSIFSSKGMEKAEAIGGGVGEAVLGTISMLPAAAAAAPAAITAKTIATGMDVTTDVGNTIQGVKEGNIVKVGVGLGNIILDVANLKSLKNTSAGIKAFNPKANENLKAAIGASSGNPKVLERAVNDALYTVRDSAVKPKDFNELKDLLSESADVIKYKSDRLLSKIPAKKALNIKQVDDIKLNALNKWKSVNPEAFNRYTKNEGFKAQIDGIVDEFNDTMKYAITAKDVNSGIGEMTRKINTLLKSDKPSKQAASNFVKYLSDGLKTEFVSTVDKATKGKYSPIRQGLADKLTLLGNMTDGKLNAISNRQSAADVASVLDGESFTSLQTIGRRLTQKKFGVNPVKQLDTAINQARSSTYQPVRELGLPQSLSIVGTGMQAESQE